MTITCKSPSLTRNPRASLLMMVNATTSPAAPPENPAPVTAHLRGSAGPGLCVRGAVSEEESLSVSAILPVCGNSLQSTEWIVAGWVKYHVAIHVH